MKKSIALGLLAALSLQLAAQVKMTNKGTGDSFPLVNGKEKAVICYDKSDALVVERSAKMLAEDVACATGTQLKVQEGTAGAAYAIIAGTIGQSKNIDQLVKAGKIDTTGLTGAWERYHVALVKNPVKGVKKAIVVAGSDRRGTAYGVLSISRAIGGSPWRWWLDAPTPQHSTCLLQVNRFTSRTPSVRYRGVFINDEDWGLLRWAKRNYEKDRGNFGPRTYAAVCELLLRLNANYLCPAMHEASLAFHQVPENRLVADTFAIVMGSSHCEPLLLNTASEWNKEKYGAWDYINNRKGVDSVLNARALELAPFENVYTLALRGLHDVAMAGGNDMTERKNTMQTALEAQRQMVAMAIGKTPETIPQAFTPYKEVLDVYDKGLKLPDDVTIIWPDDNYGYMKRLSSPEEQKRSGRSGVYYHVSYLGRPHDHLWMNTQSPNHMYEELKKAYDLTADRIWLLNAGDIKSCEFAVDLFLAMAYDIDSFDYNRCADYRTEWTCNLLGNENKEVYKDIFRTFYHLAFQRRPECMGWGQEWASDDHAREQKTDTEFSLTNYNEAEQRLAEYRRIGAIAEDMLAKMPAGKRSCFYQSVYYPVKGCELMNRMTIGGQMNRWYALQNRAATAQMKAEALQCYDSLQIITKGYNSLENGKWEHIMSMTQGVTASYFEKPELRDATLAPNAKLGVIAEGEYGTRGPRAIQVLPTFSKYLPTRTYYIDVYNQGQGTLNWEAKASKEWIQLSQTKGSTPLQQRLTVSVDWNKVPQGEEEAGLITLRDNNGTEQTVMVSAFNPATPSIEELKGLYVEDNGVISIPAAGFMRKNENQVTKMIEVPNLGCEDTIIMMGDPVVPRQNSRARNAPYLEYDFYTWEQGMVDVYTYVMPTFTTSVDRGFAGHERTNIENQYGVRIDDGLLMHCATNSWEYAQGWYESVQRNARINKCTLYVKKPGKHTVRITCQDPGTMLQKIVIDLGGMKRSYMGPATTLCK